MFKYLLGSLIAATSIIVFACSGIKEVPAPSNSAGVEDIKNEQELTNLIDGLPSGEVSENSISLSPKSFDTISEIKYFLGTGIVTCDRAITFSSTFPGKPTSISLDGTGQYTLCFEIVYAAKQKENRYLSYKFTKISADISFLSQKLTVEKNGTLMGIVSALDNLARPVKYVVIDQPKNGKLIEFDENTGKLCRVLS